MKSVFKNESEKVVTDSNGFASTIKTVYCVNGSPWSAILNLTLHSLLFIYLFIYLLVTFVSDMNGHWLHVNSFNIVIDLFVNRFF